MPSTEVRDTIALTDVEKDVLDTLLAAVQNAGTNTILRCAGGWVRDKLLGRESLDIDIALDNMLGKDFAEKVNEYLKSQGKEVHTTAVIQSNPDQSKHLETARMKVNGIWIDLVNLRSETYAQDSRIPQMEFGTAEQDAYRRDFTINSMFYNINTGSVEDLTGRGLDDLRAGIIRTPLPPMETFLDDPLRVLRAVRFGTRFGFELEGELMRAAASEQVRSALSTKVSKERVGTELEGMFNGPAPVDSVRLLLSLSLFPVVFAVPPGMQLGPAYGEPCAATMAAAWQLLQETQDRVNPDKEERRFLLLAALLLPLRGLAVSLPKGKSQPLSTHLTREAIKWRAKDADMTVLLHEEAEVLLGVYRQLVSEGGDAAAAAPQALAGAPDAVKVALGTSIRRLKQHWRLGVLLAPLLTMSAAAPLGQEEGSSGSSSGASGGSSWEEELAVTEQQRRLEVVSVLMSAAAAFQLEECWQWKALLDGKQVMSALGLSKPGPELGRVMAEVMDWQLANPGGTAEAARQYIVARHAKQG